MEDSPPIGKPVRQVDWSSQTIQRAGVCPIYKTGGHRWIGLAVSNSSAIISPIGGSFEEKDYDLLSTAIREYNEEIGDNYPNITEESVIDRYAVMNDSTIQIFVEIAPPLRPFHRTLELYDMLWVTPYQLEMISFHSQYVYPGSGIRVFQAGRRFINMFKSISSAVERGDAFSEFRSRAPFVRKQKIPEVVVQEVISNFEEFVKNVRVPSNYVGHTSIAITESTIGVINKHQVVFLIPNSEASLRVISKLPTRLYVTFWGDLRNIGEPLRRSYGLKVLSETFGNANPPSDLKRIFEGNVLKARADKDIPSELRFMEQYENAEYKLEEEKKTGFNEVRAIILASITFINNLLLRGPHNLSYINPLLEDFMLSKTGDGTYLDSTKLLKELTRLKLYQVSGEMIRIAEK